jgi:hypothetical protein
MVRFAARALLGAGLLIGSLAMAAGVRAAGEVVVTVSPSQADVGERIEVLVRTFWVVDRSDLSLPLESPIPPHPVASGVWNILYSWSDYPFDVVAQHEGDADVAVQLARDPADSTLWRGTVSLPSPGTWTIWVRNFSAKEPGSTATMTVRSSGSTASKSPAPSTNAATGRVTPADVAPAVLAAALAGLVVGVVLTVAMRRRRPA